MTIGLLLSRRIRNEDDYLLAGRSLGLGLATFSAFATWFGAETVVGVAGAIYEDGLSGGSADPFGYALCLLLMGAVFAVPLWRRGLTTLADLFRQRYSATVERVAVLLVVPTSVMWAAAQVRGFGQVLSATSGFDVEASILIATAVVIVYTGYGGLLADITTDFVQGIALIVGLILLFIVVLDATGGIGAAVAEIQPERLRLFGGEGESLLTSKAPPRFTLGIDRGRVHPHPSESFGALGGEGDRRDVSDYLRPKTVRICTSASAVSSTSV